MFEKKDIPVDRLEAYALMLRQAEALCKDEPNFLANCANISALLNLYLQDINWVGFYFLHNEELILGPFQGLPACVRIPLGKGVCGKAALTKTIQCIENVHDFPGHIACDAASNSELVIPMLTETQRCIGVLDIDSFKFSNFDEVDIEYMTKIVNIILTFSTL